MWLPCTHRHGWRGSICRRVPPMATAQRRPTIMCSMTLIDDEADASSTMQRQIYASWNSGLKSDLDHPH